MQKGFAPILVLVGIVAIIGIAGGAYYFGKLPIKPAENRKACTQEAKQCPDGLYVGRVGPNCEFSPCPIATPKISDEIRIIDGSVYRVSFSGKQDLLVKSGEYKPLGDNVNFTQANLSPDKLKILLLGYGGISIPFLYYSHLDKINVKFIDNAKEVAWSNNSRYIAYTSKPADAGPDSLFRIYDTKLDHEVEITNKPNIKNLDYDYLGFGEFQWLDDDSGINISYIAYKFKPSDPDPFIANFGAIVGEGKVVLPLVTTDTQ